MRPFKVYATAEKGIPFGTGTIPRCAPTHPFFPCDSGSGNTKKQNRNPSKQRRAPSPARSHKHEIALNYLIVSGTTQEEDLIGPPLAVSLN
jgi:hypothetical protein